MYLTVFFSRVVKDFYYIPLLLTGTRYLYHIEEETFT